MNKILFIRLCLLFCVLVNYDLKSQTLIQAISGDTIDINLNDTRGEVFWEGSSDGIAWEESGVQGSTYSLWDNSAFNFLRNKIIEPNCPDFISQPIEIRFLDTSNASMQIVVLDTLNFQWIPDSLAEVNSVYSFECFTSNPGIFPGNILIGTEGEGFLIFVNSWTLQNNLLRIYGSPISMDELFGDALINFNFSTDSLEQRSGGFFYEFDETVIYENGPLQLKLASGNVGLTGNWDFNLGYSLENGLESFGVNSNDAVLTSNFTARLQASISQLNEGERLLVKFKKTFKRTVYNIPIIVTVSANVYAKYSLETITEAQIDANLQQEISLNIASNYSSTLGWDNSISGTPSTVFSVNNPEGSLAGTLNLELRPEIKFSFYGKVVPYVKPAAHIDLLGSIALPSENWDIQAEAYFKGELGVEDMTILGDTLSVDPQIIESDHLEYITPYELQIVSGNNQVSNPSEELLQPVNVKVVDNYGNSCPHAKVAVQVSQGGGFVSESELISDESGQISINWTLGNTGSQQLVLECRNGSDEVIAGGVLNIIASFESNCGNIVTDIDGNEYEVVQIGEQCWMKENLATTRYAEGSVINEIQNPDEWIIANQGAWCNISNNSDLGLIYGKLYNGYTVSDPRNVCPAGWHVPTDSEWIDLELYLGMPLSETTLFANRGAADSVGGKLKATEIWLDNNNFNSNLSNFTALPAGRRAATNGVFAELTLTTFFWTSTEYIANMLIMRDLRAHNAVGRNPWNNTQGGSIRCIKNQ